MKAIQMNFTFNSSGKIWNSEIMKKIEAFVSRFLSYLLSSLTKTTMSWDFFVKGNLQEAYWSKYCSLILNKFY